MCVSTFYVDFCSWRTFSLNFLLPRIDFQETSQFWKELLRFLTTNRAEGRKLAYSGFLLTSLPQSEFLIKNNAQQNWRIYLQSQESNPTSDVAVWFFMST